jgi:hypothetical protein
MRERAAAQRAEQERRHGELGCDIGQAEKLVAIWNSRAARRARPSFYPTIETALLAGTDRLLAIVSAARSTPAAKSFGLCI